MNEIIIQKITEIRRCYTCLKTNDLVKNATYTRKNGDKIIYFRCRTCVRASSNVRLYRKKIKQLKQTIKELTK